MEYCCVNHQLVCGTTRVSRIIIILFGISLIINVVLILKVCGKTKNKIDYDQTVNVIHVNHEGTNNTNY